MELALDKYTGKSVSAEELWMIDPVDRFGYTCPGCQISVTPCSYRLKNKVRPYFSAKKNVHDPDCDVDGETKLIKRAKRQRISTREGFPCRFPSRLVLKETRPVGAPNGALTTSTRAEECHNEPQGMRKTQRNLRWTAGTIRPICQTFIRYPYDRDLPLVVPGIQADRYQSVFQVLKRDQILKYPTPCIFYAPISWKKYISTEELIEIQLGYGEWTERTLTRPYRVRVHWKEWSAARRNYVSSEIEISRLECIEGKNRGDNTKGWLFFIGRQDENEPSLFHVMDHRLVCCVLAEMIYPLKPAKHEKKHISGFRP